jgi:hypothetical protein
MNEPLDDRWNHTDYPVLREVVRLMNEPPGEHSVMIGPVEAALADRLTPDEIQLAAQRLATGGYVDTLGASGKRVLRFTAVSERALRATRVWPDHSHNSQDIIRLLDVEIENAKPEEKPRLRKLRETAADVGTDIFAKVMAEIVIRQAGL